MRLRGSIYHQRVSPLRHKFVYPAWYSAVDLDQSHPFDTRRHFDATRTDLAAKARAAASQHQIDASGSILMLAQPPWFGLGFNPLTVYYCHNAAGRPSGILLEVRNTPWREREVYAVPAQEDIRHRWEKTFHVSPFNPAGQSYTIQARWPQREFQLHLDLLQGSEKVLHAGFTLGAIERLTWKDHIGARLMPIITLGGIYWQALKLWCKGMPYQPYPSELKK